MKAERAIKELEGLKNEAGLPELADDSSIVDAWAGKVRVVLVAAFGEQDHLVFKHDSIKYSPRYLMTGDRDAFPRARKKGVDKCCSNIEAALYELRLKVDQETRVPAASDYDSELWSDVSALVEREEWDKVPARVAIFFEDRIRKWSSSSIENNGSAQLGQALMGQAFADEGPLRLGGQSNETQGWRNLAIGFTQAVSNVVRHNIVERDDARKYAIGVLGLASLILTQVRHEHRDLLADV